MLADDEERSRNFTRAFSCCPLASGLAEGGYRRYGLNANRAGTFLAWPRAVKKKYPVKRPAVSPPTSSR